jgi:glycosyltransferase involved in cell wall biosynthesis
VTAPATSLVLPVYNQADHIGGVVESYLPALRRLGGGIELILVTNACRDASVDVCDALAEEHPEVVTLDLAEGGWGRAVRAGIAAATGDSIGYTNSARTTPEILALCAAYSRAYPQMVIKANRRIRDNWSRRMGSLIYNLECRALFDLATWDINGTPKFFPRDFEGLLALRRDDDLVDAEFVALCKRLDYPMLEVPVLATRRHGGSSTTNYGSALKMYRGAMALRRRLGDR